MAVTGPIPLPQSGVDAFLGAYTQAINNRKAMAEAKRAQTLANLPFGGTTLSGAAGQIAGLETIRQFYGENSPQYKQAKDQFDLSQRATNSRIGYQDALAGTIPIRYTTPEGRQIIEQSNVNQGYSPAGTPPGQPVVPGAPPYQSPGGENGGGGDSQTSGPASHYRLNQTKKDVPANVLSKNLYATNIEKTLDSTDVDALTAYNGPMGAIALKRQQAKDAAGMPTDETYKKYIEAENKFKFLVGQVRQFYGDSIQPSAMEKKEAQLDPRGVFKSAEIGKKGYLSAMELLKSELKTYRDAVKDVGVYAGKTGKNTTTSKNATPQQFEVEIYDPQGKLVARGSKKDAAKFLMKHKGYYQKVISNG